MGTSFCRLVTVHAFDRQTDRRTDGHFAHVYIVRCIRCSRTLKRKYNVNEGSENGTTARLCEYNSRRRRLNRDSCDATRRIDDCWRLVGY